MFGHKFQHDLTRKYIVLFGTLFNDVHIDRTDNNGRVLQTIKVPLTYAPKDKMLARLAQDPELDREAAITLPRMSFEMTNMYYDGTRKINTMERVVRRDENNPNKFKYMYQSVPYNLNFTLYIYVKNAEDGTKIVDQILPFFTPHWNSTVQLIPEMNILRDVPTTLVSVRSEDVYEGDFIQRRSIVWTLDFIMKAEYWGPFVKAPIIKFVNTPFYFGNPEEGNDPAALMTVKPGLTADGKPTSNSADSVPWQVIDINDDFGYIVDYQGQVIVE